MSEHGAVRGFIKGREMVGNIREIEKEGLEKVLELKLHRIQL